MSLPIQVVDDDDWLTQCGKRLSDGSWKFRNEPRMSIKEPGISWILGKHAPRDAHRLAYGKAKHHEGRDAVRHVKAGVLRSAGFAVDNTPTVSNADHVTVSWPLGEWDDKQAALLDSQCMEGEI